MTVKERMIASRLIQKIDEQGSYAEKIGLSYEIEAVKSNKTTGDTKRREKTINTIRRGIYENCRGLYTPDGEQRYTYDP